MTLDRKDDRALGSAIEALGRIFGDRLLAVLLTGEASGEDYTERRSPLSVVVVIDCVDAAALRLLRADLGHAHWQRIGTPLLLDPRYIESSLDVFPLEMLDLGDRHRLLHGTDPFTDLEVDLACLRTEIEVQLRGKMLHLWEAYLTYGGERLRDLLLETPPEFEVAMRGLLRLRDRARPTRAQALLSELEDAFSIELPTFHRLAAVRLGEATVEDDELEEVFERYLDEVRALVQLVDGL